MTSRPKTTRNNSNRNAPRRTNSNRQQAKSPRGGRSPRSPRTPRGTLTQKSPRSATSPRAARSPRGAKSPRAGSNFDLDFPTLERTLQSMNPTNREYEDTAKIFLSARYRLITPLKASNGNSTMLSKQTWVQFWSSDERGVDVISRPVAAKLFDTIVETGPKKKGRIPSRDLDKLGKMLQREWGKLASKGVSYLSRFSWYEEQAANKEPEPDVIDLAMPPPNEEEKQTTTDAPTATTTTTTLTSQTSEPLAVISERPPPLPRDLSTEIYESKITEMRKDSERRQSKVSTLLNELQSTREEYEAEIDSLRSELSSAKQQQMTSDAQLRDLTMRMEQTIKATPSRDSIREEIREEYEAKQHELKRELDVAESEMVRLQALVTQQNSRIAELETRLSHTEKTSTSTELSLHNTAASIHQLEESVKEKDKYILELQDHVIKIKEQAQAALNEKVRLWNRERKRLEADVSDLRQQLMDAEMDIESYRDEIRSFKQGKDGRRRKGSRARGNRRNSGSRSVTNSSVRIIGTGAPKRDSLSGFESIVAAGPTEEDSVAEATFNFEKMLATTQPLDDDEKKAESALVIPTQQRVDFELIPIEGAEAWDDEEYFHQFILCLEDNKGRKGEADVKLILTMLRMGHSGEKNLDFNCRCKKKRGKRWIVSDKAGEETLMMKVIAVENHQVMDEFMRLGGTALNVNATSKKWSGLCCAISKKDVRLVEVLLNNSVYFDLSVGFLQGGVGISCVDYAVQLECPQQMINLLNGYRYQGRR